LGVSRSSVGGCHSIRAQTNLDGFDDHFETFTTGAAELLFPPIEAPAKRAESVMDPETWQLHFGTSFDELGCRVFSEAGVLWSDLVGLDRVRDRLERAILLPLLRQGLYQKIASAVMPPGRTLLPRGVLLTGPPGTGKTWSMRALAGRAGIPVVTLPCDALMTMWYGESERRLGEIFRLCRSAGRMILFIDEIDALTRRRQDSHETTARMVSILLTELDGLAGSSDTLLVGSANAVDSIDSAVLDRFDVKIEFSLPDAQQRRLALAYYARQLPPDDVADLVARMEGWSFRRIARFAESVVRAYVSGLDVSQLEASEPPLPRREDYERELMV
jgi:SpoVK/Ycf46/Vps4 family AAA+-type ATPase